MTNKNIAMTISEIEKSSNQFKKTHKIKVSGPYDDEEMPKWFKRWNEEVYEKKPPQWFREWFNEYDNKISDRFHKLENDFNKKFDFIFDQFEKHGWIKK